MLMFCFFIAVFSSASWFIYAVMFINSKLADAHLWEQNSEQMLLTLAVLFVPVMIIWMVFGYINQFLTNRGMNTKQNELLKQLQNADKFLLLKVYCNMELQSKVHLHQLLLLPVTTELQFLYSWNQFLQQLECGVS